MFAGSLLHEPVLCPRTCRGLDNRVYYMLAPQGQYYNFSGCGNTFNCNHPVVQVLQPFSAGQACRFCDSTVLCQ